MSGRRAEAGVEPERVVICSGDRDGGVPLVPGHREDNETPNSSRTMLILQIKVSTCCI